MSSVDHAAVQLLGAEKMTELYLIGDFCGMVALEAIWMHQLWHWHRKLQGAALTAQYSINAATYRPTLCADSSCAC